MAVFSSLLIRVIFEPFYVNNFFQAPPTYEEALSSRTSRLSVAGHQMRSLSEERTNATGGNGGAAAAAATGTSSSSSSSNYHRSRSAASSSRPLLRSARAEEIPDIYWEQAARELDFCTCRKCQVGVEYNESIICTF